MAGRLSIAFAVCTIAACALIIVGAPVHVASADTDSDLAALGSANGSVRAMAADRLADRRDDPDVVQKVSALAADGTKSPRARVEAVRVLGRFGQEGLVRTLQQIVNDANAGPVRVAAVNALCDIDHLNARNAIAAAAMNADAQVKAAGLMAAGQARVVQALPALLLAARAHAADEALACLALDAAGNVISGRLPEESTYAELRALARTLATADGSSRELKIHATFALGAMRDTTATELLLGLITTHAYSDAAEAAILEAKKKRADDKNDDGLQDGEPAGPAAPAAPPAQPDPQPAQPTAPVQPAQPAQPADPADLPDTPEEAAMRDTAGKRDGAVAIEAARLLGGYGDGIYPVVLAHLLLDHQSELATRAFSHYCSHVGASIRPRLIATLVEANAHAADTARDALVSMLRQDPASISTLAPIEGIEPAKVAALALALVDVQTPSAVSLLLPCVDAREPGASNPQLDTLRANVEVRRAVMEFFAAMALIEPVNNPAGHGYRRDIDIQRIVPPAIRLLGDEDDKVRDHALRVLENRAAGGEQRDAAREAVKARLPLETNQAYVGREAQLLADLAGGDALDPLVELLGKIDVPAARATLLRAISQLPPKPAAGKQVFDAVKADFLNEEADKDLRQRAAEVLRWVGTPQAVALLDELATRPSLDSDLQLTLLEQFRLLAARARSAAKTIVSMLETYHKALKDLAETPENRARIEQMRTLLKRAIDAIGATRDPLAVDALIPLLQFHKASISFDALGAITPLLTDEANATKAKATLMACLDTLPAEDSQKPRYLEALLAALNRLPFNTQPGWKRDIGLAVESHGLIEHADEGVARQAVVLTGKVQYYRLSRNLDAAWKKWKGTTSMEQAIRTAATAINKNWKPPTD
ncbi:MAG: HEAT repeat domain-containing protein [Planctomycetota bacterium]